MRILVTCLVLVLFIVSDIAVAALVVETVSKSIVRVRAYDNNRVTVEGAGFVVSETGHVLTPGHLVKGADRVSVVSLETGAEVLAQQVLTDRDLNLAALVVPGLGLPPLNLSEQGADIGRIVQTLTFAADNELQLSQGTIGAYHDRPGRDADTAAVHLLHHNAMITATEFGMPLFNECGQVVAVNLPDPETVNRLFRRDSDPEGVVYALRTGDIIARFNKWEIPPTVIDDACLSAVARAEQSAREKTEQAEAAEAARGQAEAEKQAAEEAKQQAETEKQAAEEAKQQAEAEKQAAEDTLILKEEEIESAEVEKQAAEAAKQQAEAEVKVVRQEQQESSQLLKHGVLVGSVLVMLALLGWFMTSHRKKRSLADAAKRLQEAEQEVEVARQAAANAPQPAPFRCLLEGQDETSQPFALSIPALALGDPAGVVVGRNPANAEFIINHGGISREHVRLSCIGGDLQVEDLGATNGTRVNGRQLSPGVNSLLRDQDQLELGPVRLTVRLL